jgi:hypothetical protein
LNPRNLVSYLNWCIFVRIIMQLFVEDAWFSVKVRYESKFGIS